jgi:hypothetical protein
VVARDPIVALGAGLAPADLLDDEGAVLHDQEAHVAGLRAAARRKGKVFPGGGAERCSRQRRRGRDGQVTLRELDEVARSIEVVAVQEDEALGAARLRGRQGVPGGAGRRRQPSMNRV